jgi:hypothetical protein
MKRPLPPEEELAVGAPLELAPGVGEQRPALV